ncbi:MAG TPA: efflux transporter outer membrane subunit [Opitutaceae bacterium]|jgi:multidrug efflux system outer membrane protein|nr:efflux transporter outer membrane subunit [Opitutaceae bacterium]
MKNALLLILTASTSLAAIPSVGPDYKQPVTSAPAAYRYAAGDVDWKSAAPSDGAPRGQWWAVFGDTTLNGLEDRALAGNQDLSAAAARVEQAFASAGAARAAYAPQVALQAAASRSQQSTTTANPYPNALSNDYSVPLVASWELDLFGRVRRLNEAAKADAEASASNLESVRLSISANVAATYFALRGLDREIAILKDTASLRQRSLDLINAQYKGGVATELDTARAQTELATVNAETHALEARRESTQGSLAVLVGDSAITFSVAPAVIDIAVPLVPAGVPSELIERRPDVAFAERELVAANARIGVAKAAFFPAISLTGSAGFESGGTEHLFGTDSRIWAFGPSLYLPIFQGGRNKANLDRAKGVFDENIASYRQQVLQAFNEVQDSLASTHILAEQALSQDQAVKSAREASQLAQKRYDAGYVSYLDVVEADRTALETERSAAQLESQRLNVAVALIKALGGGWQRPVAPTSA